MQHSREIIDSFDNYRLHRSEFVFPLEMNPSDIYDISSTPIRTHDEFTVSSATHKGFKERELAMIQFNKPPSNEWIRICKKLDHPYIIKPYQYFTGKQNAFATEMHFQSLSEYLEKNGPFKEAECAKLCRKMLLAINFLHKNNIMHRRISLDSFVFIDAEGKGPIKLTGFSKACFFEPDFKLADTVPKNFDYTAPEVLRGVYDEKCDLWSCGVVLYALLSGKLPYEQKGDDEIYKAVLAAKYNFEGDQWKDITEDSKLFIRRMMECDTGKRYTAREALNDPWLMKHTQKKLDGAGEEILKTLENFSTKSMIQRLLWFYMTDQILPSKDRELLSEVFDCLDLDHDGRLTRDDLIIRWKPDTFRKVLEHVDVDRSGDITYAEFVMGAQSMKLAGFKDMIRGGFSLLDWNQDGYIDMDDLKFAFNNSTEDSEVSESLWRELIKEGDLDQDGKLSREEFERVVSAV